MLPDIDTRLEQEIKSLNTGTAKVRVYAPPERKYSVWLGGSIVSGMGFFRSLCTSAQEYAEKGASSVHKQWF